MTTALETARNIAGFWRAGRFHPIREGTIWPKAQPGKRRPFPRQSSLDYDPAKTNDLTRSRRMTEVDMTLSQYVRSSGGIKPDKDEVNLGEWQRLTQKESGVRGLAFRGAKLNAEAMAHSAREMGFRVSDDPNEFLEQLEGDAAGYKVIRHPQWYEEEAERLYYARNGGTMQNNPSFLATWTVKATGDKASTIVESKSPADARTIIKTMLREGSYTRLTIAGRPARNGMFEAEDVQRAQRVRPELFKVGSQVRIKGTKRTDFVKAPLRDKVKGVVAYVLQSGKVVSADDVDFLNPPGAATSAQHKYAAELAGIRGAKQITPARRARVEKAGQATGLTLRDVRGQIKRALAQPNPLGEVGLNIAGGIAAGAASVVAGVLLAPLVEKYMRSGKEKKAALHAATANPAKFDAKTAANLAAIGRARLILAAQERARAARPGSAEQQRAAQQRAATYTAEGVALLERAALAYPVVGNPINVAPAAVEKLHREFRGFPTSGQVTPYHAPPGSPPHAPVLGTLHKIILKDGRTLTFENNPAALLGTVRGRRRLLIGLSVPYKTPNGANPGEVLDYGEVAEVQYITPKPHLYGDFTEKLFFHELGEEGGRCPHLVLQNGRLSFRGGDYTIKREGIRN